MHSSAIDVSSQEYLQDHTEERILAYDEALHMAGDHNKYQIRVGLLIALGMFIAGLQIMGFPFIFQFPAIQCQSPDGGWYDCVPNDQTCEMDMRPKPGTVNSMLTTFNLFCGGDEYRIIAETFYMVASALGVVAIAPIADKRGKRVALLVSYLITCLSLIGAPFSPNWIVFLILLVFSGLGRAPFIYYGFQLLVEVSNEYFRSIGVLIMGVTFALGATAAGAINEILNYDWQAFYFYFIAIPSLIGAPLVYIWADESPMSFFPRHDYDKARAALKRIASVNKRKLPFFRFENEHIASTTDIEKERKKELQRLAAEKYSYLDLFRYKSLRLSALGGAYISFVTYFIFYGQILALDVLATNPVRVAILTSVVEGLACVASVRILTKFTRRATIIMSFMITGVAFLLYGVLTPERMCAPGNDACLLISQIIGYAELCLGRFWIAILMCTTFVYANELFPTVLRSRGSGFVNFCGRLGSIIPSSVIYVCKRISLSPAVVFGALAVPVCLMAVFMRETKGKPLTHHIEEEEKREYGRRLSVEQQERMIYIEGEDTSY